MGKLFKEPNEAEIYDLVWIKGEGQTVFRLTATNALLKDRSKVLVEDFDRKTCVQKLIDKTDIERVVGTWC